MQNTVFLSRIWFWIRYLFFFYLLHPTGATVIVFGRYPIGTIGPGRWYVIWDGVVGVCWFFVPRCSGFEVEAVRGPFLYVCSERILRRLKVQHIGWLAWRLVFHMFWAWNEEYRLSLPHVVWDSVSFFWMPFTSIRRNRHLLERYPMGMNRLGRYDMRWGSGCMLVCCSYSRNWRACNSTANKTLVGATREFRTLCVRKHDQTYRAVVLFLRVAVVVWIHPLAFQLCWDRERRVSPTRQTLLAQSAQRRVMFIGSHAGWTSSFQEPLVSRTSAPCAYVVAYGWQPQRFTFFSGVATPDTAMGTTL